MDSLNSYYDQGRGQYDPAPFRQLGRIPTKQALNVSIEDTKDDIVNQQSPIVDAPVEPITDVNPGGNGLASFNENTNALLNTLITDSGTVSPTSPIDVNTSESFSTETGKELTGTTAATNIAPITDDEELNDKTQVDSDLAYADGLLNRINGNSFKYQRYTQDDTMKATILSSGIALLGAAIARNKGEDNLAGRLVAGSLVAGGKMYSEFSGKAQRSQNIGQLEAEGYDPEAIQQYVNDGKTESLIKSLHDNPFRTKTEKNVRRVKKGDVLPDNSIAKADGEYEVIYGFDNRGNRRIDSVVYKGDPLEAVRIKEGGLDQRHKETKAIELAKLRLLELGASREAANRNSPYFSDNGKYVEAGEKLPNGQRVERSGWYSASSQDGKTFSYNMLKPDHSADAIYNVSQTTYNSQGEALRLIDDIIESGNKNATGRAVSGWQDANTVTIIPENQILENKITQLNALMTISNLDKMSGVLTDRDVQILREASLVLNGNSSWEAKKEAMRRSQTQLQNNRVKIDNRFGFSELYGEPAIIKAPIVESTLPDQPQVGTVNQGYIYIGGDPAKQDSWVKQRSE